MMKNLLLNLPEDVFINNILLSKVLPIKSLLSLRCVCKYLRNIITSPAFIKMHLHHSTTSPPDQLSNQLVLIDSSTTDSPYYVFSSLKFNDGDDPCRPEVVTFDYRIKSLQIWGSCNGLLCITKEFHRNMVCLWNPSTKEYKRLPPPLPLTEPLPLTDIPIGITEVRIASGVVSITYGFGYDRFIDDYKIIRCEHIVTKFKDGTTHGHHPIPFTEFQVYTLGTNTWRKISSDNNPYKSYHIKPSLHRNKSIVFVNGALHWIMSKSLKYWRNDIVMVSFDIEKEVFQEIQKPLISKLDYNFSSNIQVLRGCLCLFGSNKSGDVDCLDVWMMMDYGVKESWTKLFTIVRKEVPSLIYRLLRFCENGEIIIRASNILLAYDPINNKARRVEFGENGMYLYDSVIYMESLVSLNSG